MTPIIGQAIKARVESIGMSKAELALRLNMSPANIHKIFKRSTIDIEALRKIGIALSYDFIAHYQYLTANAISGKLMVATADQRPRIVYPYTFQIKVMQLMKVTQQLLAEDPAKPINQCASDINFIRHGLDDLWARMQVDT